VIRQAVGTCSQRATGAEHITLVVVVGGGGGGGGIGSGSSSSIKFYQVVRPLGCKSVNKYLYLYL